MAKYLLPYPGLQPPPSVQVHESTAARFFKALTVAGLTWFLFKMLTSSFVWIDDIRRDHSRPDNNTVEHPLPSDGAIDRCVGGREWTHESSTAAHTFFKLPVESDALYVFARGSLATGKITIVDSESVDGSQDVVVSVHVKYYTLRALERANVCQLSRKRGENGIGIFTPKYWEYPREEDRLHFDIIVYLPTSVRRNRLRIKNFETDLPVFLHESGALAQSVIFDKLSLESSNMPMHIGTITAEHAYIKTSNSAITGDFNTSTSLELATSNSPISAHVTLLNDPSSGGETELKMTTSNSHVDSEIKLLSTETSKGRFKVTSKTSNGPLKIVYKESPIDSILHHVGKTSNSPASIALHPAYEGEFYLKSSVVSPMVSRGNVDDPSGRRRRRMSNFGTARRNVVSGETYWGEKKDGMGKIELQTSNSPAQLIL